MSYQKSKEERLTDIRSAIINAGMEYSIKNIVLEYFEDKYKKDFEEASDRVLEILALILYELQSATSRHTMFVNHLISVGLEQHERCENWVQLNQIHRLLPDQILTAVRSSEDCVQKTVGRSAKLAKAFEALPLDDQEKLMKGVETT